MPLLETLWLEGNTVLLEGDEESDAHPGLWMPTSLAELVVDQEAAFPHELLESVLSQSPESLTRLQALDLGSVTAVPPCVGRLPCVRELCVNVDNAAASADLHLHHGHAHRLNGQSANPSNYDVTGSHARHDREFVDRDALAPLAGLTTLRELTLTVEFKLPLAHMPLMPGLTRLEVASGGWRPANVADAAPNLAHLRVSFSEFKEDLAPLAALAALTSVAFDAVVHEAVPRLDDDGRLACLPPNLHLLRGLEHLCVHGAALSATKPMTRALARCAAHTLCCDAPARRRRSARQAAPLPVFPCPIVPTRYHRCYDSL